jgi:hypothetical protein
MGSNTIASGSVSTAMGSQTTARSAYETAIGRYTTNETPLDPLNWNANDRLFVIGNGQSDAARSNALTVLKNGNAIFDAEIQHTSTGNANMIPIAYGSINNSGTPGILGGTGNFTVAKNQSTNEYTISVTGLTLTASNTMVSVIPTTGNFRSATVTYLNGNLNVNIFLQDGTKITSPFQFIIYQL